MVSVDSGKGWILTDLDSQETPELTVPSLCEIWNWQGDTSVLPYKFESVLNSASMEIESYNHNKLKQTYIQDERFDPMGFFFLTSRSSAIGLTFALVSKDDPSHYEIPYLVADPKHKNKGVESALLALILRYCKEKGAKSVTLQSPPQNLIAAYQDGVIQAFESAGFKSK